MLVSFGSISSAPRLQSERSTCFVSFFSNWSKNKENELIPLQESAKDLAESFVTSGMRGFFLRWSNQIYDHGMRIQNEKEFSEFLKNMHNEIDMLKELAKKQVNCEVILCD